MASRYNAATAQASAMAAAAVRSVELGFSDVLKQTSEESVQQQRTEEAMRNQELAQQQWMARQRELAQQAFADRREELRHRSGLEPGSLEWILGSRLTSCRQQEPITEDWLEDLSARVDPNQPDRSTKKKLVEKSRQPQEEISLDQDHYYVLGLATDAREDEVRQAHRSLAHLYRPVETVDTARREERRRKLQAVHKAYHVLISMERRAAYDAAVAARAAQKQQQQQQQQQQQASAAAAAKPTASPPTQPKAAPTTSPAEVELKKAHPAGEPNAEVAEPRSDFDFTGDGRPFRLALGDAERVCAGFERAYGIRHARAQLRGRAPLELVERAGGLLHPADTASPFAAVGEHTLPAELRRGLRELVLARARASPRRGLRYASLGSSRALLFDLELLERLRCAGVHVAQVCLVDRAFLHPTEATQRALQQFADWNRAVVAAPDLRHEPAEVLTFGRLVDFHESPRSKGCDLLLSVGAEWRGALADCKRLATRTLAPDGLLARLGPDEQAQHTALFEAFAGDVERPRAVEPCISSAWTLITWPVQSLRPPSLQPLEDPRLSPLQRAEGEHWRVVFAPRVAVRAQPEGSAKVVDVLYPSDEVVVAGRQGPWLRLASWPGSGEKAAEAWVLSDGSELGLGTLLERVGGEGEAA